MERRITHACGHEQAHHLVGFPSQQERRARWLATTGCRACFVAGKRAERADTTARDGAAIAHLEMPPLRGSGRQAAWATTIRTGRVAAIVAGGSAGDAPDLRDLLLVTDAGWWIDGRDLPDAELFARAGRAGATIGDPVDAAPAVAMIRACPIGPV